MNFIESCRQFIAIDTSTSVGSAEAASWLKNFAQELGLVVESQEFVFGDRNEANLVIRPKNSQRQNMDFLLQSHMDTVDPGPFHAWANTNFDPFFATIEDGYIHGLGAAEVKLDLLTKIRALAQFKDHQNFVLNPVFVATFGEETGMQGALRVIRKNLVHPKYAVISEPSDMSIINAAKGFAHVEIQVPFSKEELEHRSSHDLTESTSTQSKLFKGKSTHSSTPHWGESAIKKLFKHLEQLPRGLTIMAVDAGTNFNSVPAQAFLELDFFSNREATIAERLIRINQTIETLESDISLIKDDRFMPNHSTLNIGIMRTHEDHIYLSGTCRMLPSINQETYEKWMARIHAICTEVGATFRVVDYKKPFSTPDNSILVKACVDTLKNCGIETKVQTLPSTNEASLFSRIGVECVCFGPGTREDNIHTPNERVKLSDLELSEQFYVKLIERFCL
ncbi:MAG: M20 family metallopeptidase [Bdellovibrionia bacterium]